MKGVSPAYTLPLHAFSSRFLQQQENLICFSLETLLRAGQLLKPASSLYQHIILTMNLDLSYLKQKIAYQHSGLG